MATNLEQLMLTALSYSDLRSHTLTMRHGDVHRVLPKGITRCTSPWLTFPFTTPPLSDKIWGGARAIVARLNT